MLAIIQTNLEIR